MKKLFIICIFIGLIITFSMLNRWIQGEVGEIIEHPSTNAPVQKKPAAVVKEKITKPRKFTGEVIRKTRLAPERTFETNIFYQGGEEIARHKVSRKGMVYDQVGNIPDGKVKFINETSQTYGVEYYRGGVRSGPTKVRYKGGALKYEADYQYGKLMSGREYYHDGTLKMEQDFTDAREFDDDLDVGIGKAYYRDGSIKYEWRIINFEPVGYHKSYDRKGRITAAIYYDEHGNITQSTGSVPAQAAVPASSC